MTHLTSRGTLRHRFALLCAVGIVSVNYPLPVQAQVHEEQTVQASAAVLNEIMRIPAQAIPQNMLAGAEGVAIIPNVLKGGFVIGARRGRGTLIVRNENGSWHAPVFITLTGGSIGWQAGVQSTDVILVFKTKKSVNGIFSNKLTLGVDASAAAGPVGRQASAATDGQLKAEIYSYARSRGLFLGASFDGSMIQVDGMANAAYYRNGAAASQVATTPPSATQLVQLVNSYCGTGTVPPVSTRPPAQPATPAPSMPAPQTPTLAHQYATHESDVIREQLSKTSPELFEQLDQQWRNYLALPVEVFSHESHPSIEAIQSSLDHYEQIRQNPQYQQLAAMPSFHSTYGLLRHYASTLKQENVQLVLPPPPAVR